MSASADVSPGQAPARALLWSAAAAAAFAAHAGAVLWTLREPPAPAADPAPPTAIMIDLAHEAVAPPEIEEEIAPNLTDAPDVPDVPPPPPLPEPEALAEAPPPVETVADAPPVPLPSVVLPKPAVPLEPPPEATVAERPKARPENLPRPPEPPREVAERAPVREAPKEPPSKAAVRAKIVAPAAEKVAAAQTSAGRAGSASPAQWQSKLRAHIERRKKYPSGARSRREEGTAYVRFSIDDKGTVLTVALHRSSGHADLDQAVVTLIRNASPVPAPPPGAPRDITAPVQFSIR